MAEETPKKRGPMRPGLRVLLFCSLAANLVIVGLVAGAVVGNKRVGDRPPPDADLVGAYTRALDAKDRRALEREIRDGYRAKGGDRAAVREAYSNMLAALRQVPFDPAAVEATVSKQAELAFERRGVAQEIWLKHVTEMTDAERKAYADRVEELMNRRPPKPPSDKR